MVGNKHQRTSGSTQDQTTLTTSSDGQSESLAAATKQASDDSTNRRTHQRFEVQIKSIVEQELGPKASEMLMSNLSLGGCFLRCKTPESPGKLVLVRFRLPQSDGHSPVIKAVGRVAWLRHGEGGGMGIQFVRVEEGDLSDLHRYLAGADKSATENEQTDEDLRAA